MPKEDFHNVYRIYKANHFLPNKYMKRGGQYVRLCVVIRWLSLF